MPNKPKKWIAALLGILAPPIGMMYVAQIRWAGIYFLIALAIGVAGVIYFRDGSIASALGYILAFLCAIHAYRFATQDRGQVLQSSILISAFVVSKVATDRVDRNLSQLTSRDDRREDIYRNNKHPVERLQMFGNAQNGADSHSRNAR